MLIQKFGGSSLADIEGFNAAADIISNAASTEKVVVVLSAMYGVTDLLEKAIKTATDGKDFSAVLESINNKEQGILQKMQASGWSCPLATEFLKVQLKRLESRLAGVALLEQCPPQVQAELLSTGEGFSSRLMCDVLQAQGHAARWSDTGVLPPANDSYTDSLVDVEAAAPLLQQAMGGEHDILILPGFYGCNSQGQPQLMGRNGSDYTAACAAAALQARSCEIWKDVDGFLLLIRVSWPVRNVWMKLVMKRPWSCHFLVPRSSVPRR
jgi:aspartokinase/homoserine dehydrogenase 1